MADLVANALTIIERILQNVETAQQNREQCQELGQFLKVLAGALDQLPRKELMRRPGTREFLDALEDTLQKAYKLVRSFQQESSFSQFFKAKKDARQLRKVQDKIQSYLSMFSVISHTHLADEMNDLADEVSWFMFYVAIAGTGFVFVVRLLLLRS